MSKKFVVLEKIKSYMSPKVYANKYDEIILHIYINDYPSDTSMFTNKISGETFHCKNTKVGWIEENDILKYSINPDKDEKTKSISTKKNNSKFGITESKQHQMELF